MNKRQEPTESPGAAGKRRGRPPGPAHKARPHRVVTFVTGRELERLRQLMGQGDRSLSAVVHDLLALALAQTAAQASSGGDKGKDLQ